MFLFFFIYDKCILHLMNRIQNNKFFRKAIFYFSLKSNVYLLKICSTQYSFLLFLKKKFNKIYFLSGFPAIDEHLNIDDKFLFCTLMNKIANMLSFIFEMIVDNFLM